MLEDINLAKPEVRNTSIDEVPAELQEIEQKILLRRQAGRKQPDLLSHLKGLVDSKEAGWRHVGAITQAVINPEQIPKTRLRITHTPDERITASITFKGRNENDRHASSELEPRFEIDLPIDLAALERQYAHIRKPDGSAWHASDSLNQLLDFGSYGTVTKDRYQFIDEAQKRSFDIDLYRWGEGVIEMISDAAEQALNASGITKTKTVRQLRDTAVGIYQDLALLDVEMKDGVRLNSSSDFPEALRPYLCTKGQKESKPVDVTGLHNLKGRKLTAFQGAAGHFRIDANTAQLIDRLALSPAVQNGK